ncbi:MAG: hypothetical protein ACXWAX_10440, partial [Chthoniobacterales bacterium]
RQCAIGAADNGKSGREHRADTVIGLTSQNVILSEAKDLASAERPSSKCERAKPFCEIPRRRARNASQ